MDNNVEKKDAPGQPQKPKKQEGGGDPQINKQSSPLESGQPIKPIISPPARKARRPIPVIPDEPFDEFEQAPYFMKKGRGYWKWFIGIIVVGVIVWMIPGSFEEEHQKIETRIESAQVPGEKRDIDLFITDKSLMGLIHSRIPVDLGGGVDEKINRTLEVLFEEYQKGGGPFPQEMLIREVFMNGEEAIVSIDGAFRKKFMGGGWSELLAVYSLVNTITENFDQVKEVRILIDDQETPFFVSHVSLDGPLRPNLNLLVLEETPDL